MLEGIPAVIIGIITLFYLTDRPAHARWLPADERSWIVGELDAELVAKKTIRSFTILEAFSDPRILWLIVAWFLALTGSLGTTYWLPTFVKRLTEASDRTVTSLLVIPAVIGVAGMILNGWHSDRTGERHAHTAIPLLAAGSMFVLLAVAGGHVPVAVTCLLLGSGFLYAYYPTFWAIPTQMLSESAAAATIGLINSIGQLGGFAGNYSIGGIERSDSRADSEFRTHRAGVSGVRERDSCIETAESRRLTARARGTSWPLAYGLWALSLRPLALSPHMRKRITSLIDGLLVSTITSRSIPTPSPPVGGRPYSRART